MYIQGKYSGFKHYRQDKDEKLVGQLELKTNFILEFMKLMCGHKGKESEKNKENQSRTEGTPTTKSWKMALPALYDTDLPDCAPVATIAAILRFDDALHDLQLPNLSDQV